VQLQGTKRGRLNKKRARPKNQVAGKYETPTVDNAEGGLWFEEGGQREIEARRPGVYVNLKRRVRGDWRTKKKEKNPKPFPKMSEQEQKRKEKKDNQKGEKSDKVCPAGKGKSQKRPTRAQRSLLRGGGLRGKGEKWAGWEKGGRARI